MTTFCEIKTPSDASFVANTREDAPGAERRPKPDAVRAGVPGTPRPSDNDPVQFAAATFSNWAMPNPHLTTGLDGHSRTQGERFSVG